MDLSDFISESKPDPAIEEEVELEEEFVYDEDDLSLAIGLLEKTIWLLKIIGHIGSLPPDLDAAVTDHVEYTKEFLCLVKEDS